MWSVIVPVKSLELAKTRLAPHFGPARSRLALAFACDAVAAAVRCPEVGRVYAVTGDPSAAAALSALGAVTVPDDGAAGLNGALEAGEQAARRRGGRGRRVVALTADLPSLRPAELARALASAAAVDGRSFVADTPGSGTTLLAAGAEGGLRPLFGAGSRYAHELSGAVRLAAGRTVCRDVDTYEDLMDAMALGLGGFTLAALEDHGMELAAPRGA